MSAGSTLALECVWLDQPEALIGPDLPPLCNPEPYLADFQIDSRARFLRSFMRVVSVLLDEFHEGFL